VPAPEFDGRHPPIRFTMKAPQTPREFCVFGKALAFSQGCAALLAEWISINQEIVGRFDREFPAGEWRNREVVHGRTDS
jgi:hypothetical protein